MESERVILLVVIGVLVFAGLIALISTRSSRQDAQIRQTIPPPAMQAVQPVLAELSEQSIRRFERKTSIHWEYIARGYTKPSQATGIVRSNYYAQLEVGDRLKLVRQPNNPVDPNAVLIYADCGKLDGIDLGFVPKAISAELAAIMDAGTEVLATVNDLELTGKYHGADALFVASQAPRLKTNTELPKRRRRRRLEVEEKATQIFSPTSPADLVSFNCPACGYSISHPAIWFIQRGEVVCEQCKGVISIRVNQE